MAGVDERFATVSASITTTAQAIALVTGKVIRIKACVIRSSVTGVVAIQDGSGGTTKANIYMVADTQYVLDDKFWGEGMAFTSGTGVYAVLSSATLTATFRYWVE